jgi:hypothetical protein
MKFGTFEIDRLHLLFGHLHPLGVEVAIKLAGDL